MISTLCFAVFGIKLLAMLAAALAVVAGMSFATMHDIGSQIKVVRACDDGTLTAGGSGDNTQIVGQIIDRMAYGLPLSCVVAIGAKAVLAANKKLTIKSVTIETGDDPALGDTSNYSTPADLDLLVDSGSGSTLRGQEQINIDLAGAKRYLRLDFTPDLNASGTDTAQVSAMFVFGGVPEPPTATP